MGAVHGVVGHFVFWPPPTLIRLLCLVEDGHRRRGMSGQERRRRDIAAGAGSDTLGNDGLIRGDVVRGNVLHRDLLLPSASMVV